MDLVLVGQPYSGKSTIFNAVVGYKSVSTNAPGSTSEHAHGALELDGEWLEVIDLPGIYSLQVSDDAGDPAVEHILEAPADTVLINVIDASVLSRSLELTLQLTELRRPMVVALNMTDEARRKGITIDVAKLSRTTRRACCPDDRPEGRGGAGAVPGGAPGRTRAAGAGGRAGPGARRAAAGAARRARRRAPPARPDRAAFRGDQAGGT